MAKKTISKKLFIKEIFENFGYIIIDPAEPDLLVNYVKENFIRMEFYKHSGMFDEYKFTGTYSMLKKMLKENWPEDYRIKDYFVKL